MASPILYPLQAMKSPKIYLFFLTIFFSFACQNKASKNNFSEKTYINQVEQNLGYFTAKGINNWSLEQRMKHYKVNGLSIAIIKNYKVVCAKGYGWANVEEKQAVTPQTIFEPGSLSKSVHAMGVLKLVEGKKLDLDQDINKYLTTWKFPYDSISKHKKITLKNILSHTAGLSVHGFYGYLKGDNFPTIPQILDGKIPANSAPVSSIFEPNLRFEYSGGGTMISQLMLMDVSHIPYDKFMAKNVLQPLKMTHSFFTQPAPQHLENQLATAYDSLGKKIKGGYPIMIEQAAAGLWTTPSDIAQFIIETQLSLQGKSNKVLSKAMTIQMLQPYLSTNIGLGVSIFQKGRAKYFGHDAGNMGFGGAYYGSFEDGNGVAIFINTDYCDLIPEVINAVAAVYEWEGFEKPKSKKIVSISDNILRKYIGQYRLENQSKDTLKVFIVKKENAYWWVSKNVTRKIYFTSDNLFFNMESPAEKAFYLDENGNVAGFFSKNNKKIHIFRKL